MTREFKFETLQLHAGQVVVLLPSLVLFQFTKQRPLYLMIHKKVQNFLPFKKLEISIPVSLTQQHQPLKSVSQPLKVV